MPPGRPSEYSPDYVAEVEKFAKNGATDMEIADFFDVSVRTIYRWRAQHDDFCHAIKAAKLEADARVERSLYQRALGYEQESVKIFLGKDGEPVLVPFREHITPDSTAMIFWLKNRKPKEWRDKQEVEHSGGVILINDIPDPDYSQRDK